MSETQQPSLADLVAAIQKSAGQEMTTPQTHANVGETTLEDESVSSSEFNLYKGRKDVVDRIGILMPNKVKSGRVHFIPTQGARQGGYFICESKFSTQGGQEIVTHQAPCCQRLDLSRKRFASLIIHYATDQKGKPVPPLQFGLKVWRYGPEIFVSLRNAHAEHPLDTHDLLAHCTEEQYQRMTIQPARESLVASKAFQEIHGRDVAGWIASMQPRLDRVIGKRLDPVGWAQLLGSATPGVAATSADAPIDNIADLLNIGGSK